jgi:hypothetical protein
MSLKKARLITIGIWGAITVALAIWYVFIAWRWTTIDAEYETYPDFRLGFFALTFLPALIVILVVVLWLEHRWLQQRGKKYES